MLVEYVLETVSISITSYLGLSLVETMPPAQPIRLMSIYGFSE